MKILKSKLGYSFIAIYVAFIIYSVIQSSNCSGFLCGLIPLTIIQLPWVLLSNEYLNNFSLTLWIGILLNIIILYFIGYLIQFKTNKTVKIIIAVLFIISVIFFIFKSNEQESVVIECNTRYKTADPYYSYFWDFEKNKCITTIDVMKARQERGVPEDVINDIRNQGFGDELDKRLNELDEYIDRKTNDKSIRDIIDERAKADGYY